MTEIQSFEASKIGFYKCTICASSGERNWKLGTPINNHGEVGGWENSTCRTCGSHATIWND